MCGMFRVQLEKCGQGASFFQLTVSADTLDEAESAARNFVSQHLGGVPVVLVHVGDLTYEVYELTSPLARIKIRTA